MAGEVIDNWKTRLLFEHKELAERIDKLVKYLQEIEDKRSRGLPVNIKNEDYILLNQQLSAMQQYERILRARIDKIKEI